MSEPMTMMAVASFGLVALSIAVFASLKGWQGWLELKRMELAVPKGQGEGRGPIAERIELADLRERVRKLETIAAGVDL